MSGLIGHRLAAFHPFAGRLALSAADLDRGEESYGAALTKVVAAVVALMWGVSMTLTGLFGVQPGTNLAIAVAGVGLILIILAVDQLCREINSLT